MDQAKLFDLKLKTSLKYSDDEDERACFRDGIQEGFALALKLIEKELEKTTEAGAFTLLPSFRSFLKKGNE